MNKRVELLLHVLLLVLLLSISLWADDSALKVAGPARLVQGPQGTVYIVTGERIVRASAEGDLLSEFDLKGMGIAEPVADLFIEPNGEMLIGLMESQLIRTFSPDGKPGKTHKRAPSLILDGRNFKFTKDPRSGKLYVADSEHHRIQIYGSDENELMELLSPSGRITTRENVEEGNGEYPKVFDADLRFLYPNALAIDGEQVFATDTDNHRIVVFGLDGKFERIIPTAEGKNGLTEYSFPVHFARYDKALYVINRGFHFVGGEVIAMDLDGSRSRSLHPPEAQIDPYDILARENDLLIADNTSKNILRYDPDGTYLGYFGRAPLLEQFSQIAFKQNMYRAVRVYALAGLGAVLVSLLFLKRRDRISREEQGLPSEHQPVRAFQDILGPEGSFRRWVMLVMVPGLGQIAAGRTLRAVMLMVTLSLIGIFFLATVVFVVLNGVAYIPLTLVACLLMAAAWTGIVLDGIRLNKAAVTQHTPPGQRRERVAGKGSRF
ncbi:MAG: hypothetical protein A2078_06535 [Nitrospirae bacterium GWC2_57_9]|nr:MAG: hypothetical protein A2078_06535 [Nitrospirae bacterium GWC2_57_9]